MTASTAKKKLIRRRLNGLQDRSQEGLKYNLEDLLWEYIEEYGFSDNAKHYFEAQFPILIAKSGVGDVARKA